MMKKPSLYALAAAVLALGAGTASAEDIKIGALMSMTGDLQAYGETSLNGIQLAVKEINAAGGAGGSTLQVVVGDDQTNPQVGVDAAKRLVEVEKVAALVGGLASGVTIPVATSVSSAAKTVQISGRPGMSRRTRCGSVIIDITSRSISSSVSASVIALP